MFRRREIFLSHSGGDRRIAFIAAALEARGYYVAFDGQGLFTTFDVWMKRAARRCDLFVFFVSPCAVRKGSACHDELRYRSEKYPDPSGNVLLIEHLETPKNDLPPYVSQLKVHRLAGNFMVNACDEIEAHCRFRMPWSWLRFGGLLAGMGLAVPGTFLVFSYYEQDGAPLTREHRVGLAVLVSAALFVVALLANAVSRWRLGGAAARRRDGLLAGDGAEAQERPADPLGKP